MLNEYAEPTTVEEMTARYARIRRQIYQNRARHGLPEQIEVVIFREHNAHVADWLKWQLAREAGMSAAECEIYFDRHKETRISVEQIIREEADKAGVTPDEIKGRRRAFHIMKPRQAAMARAYVERPDLSLPQIGRMFGGRDHTTILHACKKLGVHVECKVGTPGRPG